MLVWLSPLWLLALAAVPLIWLLHRLNNRDSSVAVSSLLFWKTVTDETKRDSSRAKADPAWRLRALIVAMIVLSMAGPRWLNTGVHIIDIWFDDSFSMQTLENGTTRFQLAAAALDANLRQLGNVDATVHSLNAPFYQPLRLNSDGEANWREQLLHWIKIGNTPIQAPLPGKGEQWLVTDAAHGILREWLEPFHIDRVLQVGDETENSAISLLSMRPNLKNPKVWNIVARINHFGIKSDRRTLELVSGDSILERRDVIMNPEQSSLTEFNIARDQLFDRLLTARFSTTDALPRDDRLDLVIPMPIATRPDGNCPPPLIAAIRAHPFLNIAITATTRPELVIACGNEAPGSLADALIRFRHSNQTRRLDIRPVWLVGAGSLIDVPIPEKHMTYFQEPAPGLSVPLLAAGQTPLITITEAGSRILDCFIDFSAEDFSRQAEYPLLLAGLVDRVLDRAILDPVAHISISREESRIAPQSLRLSSNTNLAGKGLHGVDIAPSLLYGAILLLLVDGWLSRNKR